MALNDWDEFKENERKYLEEAAEIRAQKDRYLKSMLFAGRIHSLAERLFDVPHSRPDKEDPRTDFAVGEIVRAVKRVHDKAIEGGADPRKERRYASSAMWQQIVERVCA